MADPVEVLPLRTVSHGPYDLMRGVAREVDKHAAGQLAAAGLVEIVRHSAQPPGAVTPEDKLPAPITPEDGLLAEWRLTGLKSSPAVYLRRTPDGPRSALARRLVEAGLGAG